MKQVKTHIRDAVTLNFLCGQSQVQGDSISHFHYRLNPLNHVGSLTICANCRRIDENDKAKKLVDEYCKENE